MTGPSPLNACAPDHALTWREGAVLTPEAIAAGKTAACMNCGREFNDLLDATETKCGGVTR